MIATVVLVMLAASCGAAGPPAGVAARHASTTVRRPGSSVPPSTTSTVPVTTSTTSAGSLPQTDALPTTADPQFSSEMDALWNGVVSGSTQDALSAFFPEGAYLQLKTIAGVQSDYTNRLVHDYGLDIAAAHAALGPDATRARFVGIDADASYAHWVPVGVCDNDVGYYELPNSRLVYQVDGQTRSFGIASMISWRGEWYVVHLGAILRSSDAGVVDDPQVGTGTPVYSSTC